MNARTIRKIIFEWTIWRNRQRLFRACPEARERYEQRNLAKKLHRNARKIEQHQRAITNGLLGG